MTNKYVFILVFQLSIPPGSEYTVVIEDRVGYIVRERVGAVNCSSTQCSHTYYPAVGSRAEFGVSVETAGCVTRQTVCQERQVCEQTPILTSSLNDWSFLVYQIVH